MVLTEAEVQSTFWQLLGRAANEGDKAHLIGFTSVAQLVDHIMGSAEYRNKHGKQHPLHWGGKPISETEARSFCRTAYARYIDYPGSQINDAEHANAMADEVFPNLLKNATGYDRYGGDFQKVLADHEPTIRERAGVA